MASAPITLYLDIPEGQHGDLEVVAEASIAWARTIKEIARVLYPDIEIRVEVLDADEGSFGLNARIRSLSPQAKGMLVGILAGAASHFALETVDYFYEKFLDSIFGTDPPPAEVQSRAEVQRVQAAVSQGAGRRSAEQVFRALQTDSVILGVGITAQPDEEPASIIPRAAFLNRGGYVEAPTEETRERTRSERIDAILIKPVLVPNSRRKWRFQTSAGEFSFSMKDEKFSQRLLQGIETIPMVAGVILDVDVEVSEVLSDGLWRPKSRAIVKVWSHRFDASALLPFPDDEDDDE